MDISSGSAGKIAHIHTELNASDAEHEEPQQQAKPKLYENRTFMPQQNVSLGGTSKITTALSKKAGRDRQRVKLGTMERKERAE